jgi:hypothetical protein
VSAVDHICPGCGKPVRSGEDYVVAREYVVEPGFTLHALRDQDPVRAERRFHVEHFRGQIGDRLYELAEHVHTHSPTEQ